VITCPIQALWKVFHHTDCSQQDSEEKVCLWLRFPPAHRGRAIPDTTSWIQ